MPVGRSNRIVIDVDEVALKRRLYAALAQDGRSLKEWFVTAAHAYLDERIHGRQLDFGALRVAEPEPRYGTPRRRRRVERRKHG